MRPEGEMLGGPEPWYGVDNVDAFYGLYLSLDVGDSPELPATRQERNDEDDR